jgi:hypothetical protein
VESKEKMSKAERLEKLLDACVESGWLEQADAATVLFALNLVAAIHPDMLTGMLATMGIKNPMNFQAVAAVLIGH